MAPKVIGKGPNGEDVTEVDVTDTKNYVVDCIMGTRLHGGSRQFLIRYHDYPTLEWIEDGGLIHCSKALTDFKKTMGYPARGKGKYPGFPLDHKEHMVPPDNQEGNAPKEQEGKAKRIVIGKGPNGEAIVRYEGELDDNGQFQVERVMGVRDVGDPLVREFLLKLKDKPDLEWIEEENLKGCEDLVVRFKMEVGVQHLSHDLDKPLLVPADKPRASHTQAQSSTSVQERRSSAHQKLTTGAAKQKPGGSGLRPKSLAMHTHEKKTVDEDDREPHPQLPEDMPSDSRKRGAAPPQRSGGTDGAASPKSAAGRSTVPSKKVSRVEVDTDENEHKETPASPGSVEPPTASPDQEPHEELLKKIEATHDLSKSDKERMKAIIDYVVQTRCLEEDEREELKSRMEKVLIFGTAPHLVVDDANITSDVVKSYEDACRGANRIIKEDFPKLRDEFAKEARDGKGVVDALVKGQWFERVAAYYFRKLREVRFPVTVAAVEAVAWQLVAPICPQQRSKMNDEAREFFAATLKKKALAAKIITD